MVRLLKTTKVKHRQQSAKPDATTRKLEDLKLLMSYEGRMRDFKKALFEASKELEKHNVIVDPKFETNTRGEEQLKDQLKFDFIIMDAGYDVKNIYAEVQNNYHAQAI